MTCLRTGYIAAAIALGGLLGACAGTPEAATSGVANNPSPSTLASAAAASAPRTALPSRPAAVPAPLAHAWIGPTRAIPGLAPPPITSFLELTSSTMKFNAADSGRRILASAASLTRDGTLEFKLDADRPDCRHGDVGTYAFTLSPSGRALTLTTVAEECALRAAAIAGDWIRSRCPNPLNPCLGDVDAGDHLSVVFTPFVPPSAWQYHYGRFGYTVPAGWMNAEDASDAYVLLRDGGTADAGIFTVAGVVAHSQAADCPEKPDPRIRTTTAAITRWLTALPGLDVSKPAPVTIGGLKGITIDVAVDPKASHTCPFTAGRTGASLFSVSDPAAGFDWGIWGDGRMRLFLLDLGDERTLMIDIEAQEKATWDALLPDAMPIVESFSFRH
jgi:hypothetical protein